MEIEKLRGVVLKEIEGCRKGSEYITFRAVDGRDFYLRRMRDYYGDEEVEVKEVVGNVDDVIGLPLSVDAVESEERIHSFVWAIRLSTSKGSLTIRWHGESAPISKESAIWFSASFRKGD